MNIPFNFNNTIFTPDISSSFTLEHEYLLDREENKNINTFGINIWTHNYSDRFVDVESEHPCYPIYPTPLLGQDMTQGQFLSGV